MQKFGRPDPLVSNTLHFAFCTLHFTFPNPDCRLPTGLVFAAKSGKRVDRNPERIQEGAAMIFDNVKRYAFSLGQIAVALLLSMSSAGAQDEAARALVKAVLDALPKVPFVAMLEVTTPQGVRTLQLSHKEVDNARASYLEVTSPESLEGIRFLFIERADSPPEQFIKVKAGRNAVRVADQIRKQPFLDSTFYVSDMVQPELDAYTYRFVGEQDDGDRRCRVVESIPKNKDVELYSKTLISIDPKDLIAMRRQFFDKKGQLLKVWTVTKVEKMDGFWTLLRQEMVNEQEKVRSSLDVKEIKYNVQLPDSMFTPKHLLR